MTEDIQTSIIYKKNKNDHDTQYEGKEIWNGNEDNIHPPTILGGSIFNHS
jgi:hypothetical protein